MAKKGRKRPPKRGRFSSKEGGEEFKKAQAIKDRERESQQHKSLTRQVRGAKWDPEEFDEEFEGDQ